MQDLRVGQYSFEQVVDYKSLGVNINQRNNMHNELRLILVSENNEGYHTMKSILTSSNQNEAVHNLHKSYCYVYMRDLGNDEGFVNENS